MKDNTEHQDLEGCESGEVLAECQRRCCYGPGTSEEIRDKIFQSSFTGKPTGEDAGLGLSLAWALGRHNGEK